MQNLVHRDYSKHIHMRTHTHTYTHKHSDYAKLTLCSLKQAATEMIEDSSTEQKAWQVYSFGKRNVFRLHLNESREVFWGGVYSCGPILFYGCQCLKFFNMCSQMLMHEIACRGCMNSINVSTPIVDWEINPQQHWGIEPASAAYRTWW